MLKADDAKVVPVSLGKHLVQATSADGQDEWRNVINISQAGQEMVEIKLTAAHQKRAAEADLQQNPTWTDPATGLMWARQDNGSDVTWNQASNYCRNLRLAGYSNWRLPAIDELAGIYDQTQNWEGWHIKGGILPTGGRSWSNTLHASGQAWSFSFRVGNRGPDFLDRFSLVRALCVRHPGE